MNEDMSQFLGVFLDEANEQMQLLEEDILKLEHASSPELLQEIFRAAHTLKGSSRAMGFVAMGELTHAMEDVFDQLRQDKLVVTRPMIDALFAGLDSLKAMIEDIGRDGNTECDTRTQTASLRAALEQSSSTATPAAKPAKATGKPKPEKPQVSVVKDRPKDETKEVSNKTGPTLPKPAVIPAPTVIAPPTFKTVLSDAAQSAMQQAHNVGCTIFGLKIEIAHDCVMKSVRAMMAMQALESVSSTLASLPDEDGLENEQFEHTFEVVLASEAEPEEIVAAVEGVNEVRCALIAPWEFRDGKATPLERQSSSMTQGGNGDTNRDEGDDTDPDFWSAQIDDSAQFRTQLSEDAQNARQQAQKVGCTLFGLKIAVAPDSVMKSVRAMMALQALERVGSVLATLPEEDGLEEEQFGTLFEVVLASESDAAHIVTAVQSVNEIRCAYIGPFDQHQQQTEAVSQGASTPTASKPSATSGNQVATRAATQGHESAKDEAKESGKEPAKETGKESGKESGKDSGKGRVQNATVRVDVARLDKLLNLVGELVIDRTRIARLGQRFEQEYAGNALLDSLNETSVHIGRITDELQDEIMKARMLPLDSVFSRFPRMIRDLAQKLEKEVAFVVEGQETELDRSVIEVIGDPLIHMLRNSIDHGIELPDEREKAGKPRAGTVTLRARHQENSIVIEIEDDGRGIDPDKLRASAIKKGILTEEAAQRMNNREAIHLIFAPGFSTAQTLTDVSGRGVGMDIVRSNMQRLGALIDIDSKVGKGTTFRVQLPLTLAIIRGLLVSVDSCVYALPLNSVVETLQVEPKDIHVINHREVIWQRERTLPLVRLRDVFPTHSAQNQERYQELGLESLSLAEKERVPVGAGMVKQEATSNSASDTGRAVSRTRARRAAMYVVVAGVGEKQVGFVVDSLVGEQEVVIKTLGKFIGEIRGIAGATILGDGRVALIADINGLTAIAAEEKGKAYAA